MSMIIKNVLKPRVSKRRVSLSANRQELKESFAAKVAKNKWRKQGKIPLVFLPLEL